MRHKTNKPGIFTALFLLAVLVALMMVAGIFVSSYVGDPNVEYGRGYGDTVTITLQNDGQHAGGDASSEDNAISSLRVLIYDAGSGVLMFNLKPSTFNPARLDIWTGEYDFVFVTNESSALTTTFGTEANIDRINKLNSLQIARTAIGSAKNIPMVTTVESVKVLGDEEIQLPGKSSVEPNPWTINVERAAIRLRLTLKKIISWMSGRPRIQLRI
jgi:hypothetical protein